MSKTPDEIKKSMECCAFPYLDASRCGNCQYDKSHEACLQHLLSDAIALIQQLEAERDGAVADIKMAAIYLCCACKKYHPAERGVSHHYCEEIGEREDFTGAISCGMFEWRGVQKEE